MNRITRVAQRSNPLRHLSFQQQTHSTINTMKSQKCPKCGATTEEGFMTDYRHPLRWISGKPEKSLLGLVKTLGKEQRHVECHRCRECGFLELYAEGSAR